MDRKKQFRQLRKLSLKKVRFEISQLANIDFQIFNTTGCFRDQLQMNSTMFATLFGSMSTHCFLNIFNGRLKSFNALVGKAFALWVETKSANPRLDTVYDVKNA